MKCHFCPASDPPARYTCPQCQAPYCSLKCYQCREHLSCSENFYKECVSEELRAGGGGDKDAKARMIETLQRVHANDAGYEEDEDDALDSDDEDDLAERMKGVDLDDAEGVWEALTPAERKDFERLMESGDVEKVMPKFKPFWEHYEERKLVAEVNGEKSKKSFKDSCPAVETEIPEFKTLFKGEPSPTVKFGLINVLYAYCYGARFFLGDFHSEPMSASYLVVALSASLRGSAAPMESADGALEAASAEARLRPDLSLPPGTLSEVKKDVWKVVRGPGGDSGDKNFYIQAALSDTKRLLERAIKVSKKKSEGDGHEGFDRSQVKKAVKKVEFYLSWSMDYYEFDLLR